MTKEKIHKGTFITATKFTEPAIKYASSVETKVVLLDGQRLAELMIENGVGVSTAATYEIKKLDMDFLLIINEQFSKLGKNT